MAVVSRCSAVCNDSTTTATSNAPPVRSTIISAVVRGASRTVSPAAEHRVGKREKLIARSREKYAASRAGVEAKIERWLNEREADPRKIHKGRIPFLPVRL